MTIPTDPGRIRRFGPDFSQAPESKPKLSLNLQDIVSARVLRKEGPGLFLLAIRGRQVTAGATAELVPGRVYLMEVKSLAPTPVLALARENAPAETGRVLARLAEGLRQSPFKALAQALNARQDAGASQAGGEKPQSVLGGLLADISPGAGKEISPDALRKFIQGSGLGWEAKLKAVFSHPQGREILQELMGRDLKGMTLHLLAGSRLEPPMAQALSSFVDKLQNLQLANVTAMEENGKFFLSIPFLQGEDFHFVQFLADLSREGGKQGGKKKNSLVTASLCLELSSLGPVRADAALLDNRVRAAFTVSSQEIAGFMESRVPDLKNRLAAHGMAVNDVSFRVEQAAVLQNLSLADELLDPSETGLDLVI